MDLAARPRSSIQRQCWLTCTARSVRGRGAHGSCCCRTSTARWPSSTSIRRFPTSAPTRGPRSSCCRHFGSLPRPGQRATCRRPGPAGGASAGGLHGWTARPGNRGRATLLAARGRGDGRRRRRRAHPCCSAGAGRRPRLPHRGQGRVGGGARPGRAARAAHRRPGPRRRRRRAVDSRPRRCAAWSAPTSTSTCPPPAGPRATRCAGLPTTSSAAPARRRGWPTSATTSPTKTPSAPPTSRSSSAAAPPARATASRRPADVAMALVDLAVSTATEAALVTAAALSMNVARAARRHPPGGRRQPRAVHPREGRADARASSAGWSAASRARDVHWMQPASGLVTALDPVMRACGGTWVAHGSGIRRPRHRRRPRPARACRPTIRPYTLRRVWLTPREEDGYYYGLANGALWPLCHIAYARPVFDDRDWRDYVEVNRRFADTVLDEISNTKAIVFVQDYHFALLPRMIKDVRPDAVVCQFWHIPWPNPEAFRICPWKETILDGLLGNDLLAFHIQFHCNNFLETVDRTLEARIDREHFAVYRGGHRTFVKPFPISIDPALWASVAPGPRLGRATSPATRRRLRVGDARLVDGRRSARLHQGHSRAAAGLRAAARAPPRVARAGRVPADRRADARSARPVPGVQRRGPVAGAGHQPALRHQDGGRRSSTGGSTTRPRRSAPSTAPPTSAWCRRCTTA